MDFLNTVYVFLIQWDIPIYFVAAIGLVVNLVRLFLAQQQLRRAMFGVERENGRQLRLSAILGMLLFGGMFAGVAYVGLEIAPTLPSELLEPPPPTPNVFATPLSSPTPDSVVVDDDLRPRVTPDLVATATLPLVAPPATIEGTLTPTNTRPASLPTAGDVFIPEGGGCTPGVNISFPRQNMTVFGTVEFTGSASDSGFSAYELEMRGQGTGNEWVNVLGGRIFVPVSNDILGTVNLGTLENGGYTVRLTTIDGVGAPSARCTIEILVNNE